MADNDHAIIVGIDRYPEPPAGLGPLRGPENDARAFEAWAVSPTGGAVPAANVQVVLGSVPNPSVPTSPRPLYWEIEEAFGRLIRPFEERLLAGRSSPIGRRFYVYLAGHGFDPEPGVTALLAANATPLQTGLHFVGKPYAEHFWRGAMFEEIVLLADCCREQSYMRVPVNPPRFREVRAPDLDRDRVRRFYAFGAPWRRNSWERPFPPNNAYRGVFTRTLLDGLGGEAADPSTGQVTAQSLTAYLHEAMPLYLDPPERDDPRIAKAPDVWYEPKHAGWVLATVAPQTYPVTLRASLGDVGRVVQVHNGTFRATRPVPPDGLIPMQLGRGLYAVEFVDGGSQRTFIELPRDGGTYVSI